MPPDSGWEVDKMGTGRGNRTWQWTQRVVPLRAPPVRHLMGDFRDLPLLPEAPATARITTWWITIYGGIFLVSTIILRFSMFFCECLIPSNGGIDANRRNMKIINRLRICMPIPRPIVVFEVNRLHPSVARTEAMGDLSLSIPPTTPDEVCGA